MMNTFKKILLISLFIPFLLVVGVLVFLKIYGRQITEGAVATVGRNFIAPTMSYALLTQLFAQNFERQEDALKYIDALKQKNFSEAEISALMSFLNIRNEVIDYKVANGKLPAALSDLRIPSNRLNDQWGNPYRYLAQDGFILLGSTGQDGQWNLNDSTKTSILSNMHEFIYRVDDDFIVKVLPDTSNFLSLK